MTGGHFGLAAAIKPFAPKTPLWALMLGTYFLDVLFIFLAAGGIESFSQGNGGQPSYGGAIIHANYTHSLVGALIVAGLAGLVSMWVWNRSIGLAVGAVVFSHWILDLVVHRPDLPILPGDLAALPKLGLGLWMLPVLSAVVELLLILVGSWLYYRGSMRSEQAAAEGSPNRAIVATSVIGGLMLLLLASDVFGLPLLVAVALMLLIIVLGGRLDSRMHWQSAVAAH